MLLLVVIGLWGLSAWMAWAWQPPYALGQTVAILGINSALIALGSIVVWQYWPRGAWARLRARWPRRTR